MIWLLAVAAIAAYSLRPMRERAAELVGANPENRTSRVWGATLKAGVDDSRLRPEALRIIEAAVQAASEGFGPVVVTSTFDGTHEAGSLHYKNLAVDLRSNHLSDPPARARYRDAIRARLGAGYDVLSEGPGGTTAGYDRDAAAPHVHGEWDPHGVTGVG